MIKLVLAATLVAASLLAAPFLAAPALAQPMAMPMAPAAAGDGSTAAYRKASQAMMTNMDVPYTGNADQDFVAGMLPHHGGAIDMARVELQYGHDPALHRLARDIIAAQQKEQAFMRAWQARHPMAAAAKP